MPAGGYPPGRHAVAPGKSPRRPATPSSPHACQDRPFADRRPARRAFRKEGHAVHHHSVRSRIDKVFPGARALNKVDFELRRGEVHALLGENGAGKSTLVKCLTGAYHRDGGTITLDGTEVDPRDTLDAQRLGIGTVYQEVNLLPNLSVAENLYIGRQPRRFGLVDTRRMNRMARELLKDYELDIDVTAGLDSYSVAIQQVIAIARAVDLSGKVLILDEPTASLDAHEVAMLFRVVRRLKERGLGIIFITHFLEQVFEITDRITVLRNGQLVGTRETAGLERLDLIAMMLGRELQQEVRSAAMPIRVRLEISASASAVSDARAASTPSISMSARRGDRHCRPARLRPHRDGGGHVRRPQADSGTAEIDGKPVDLSSPRAAIRQKFGFCPEDRKTDGIIGDLSVRENIALALQARRGWARPISRAEQDRLADHYIKALDIRTSDREKADQAAFGRQPAEGDPRPLAGDRSRFPDPRRADPRHRRRCPRRKSSA